MGRIVKQKVKAASIIETIVALVIILVIFGITTSVIVQISLHNTAMKNLRAGYLLEFYSNQTESQSSFSNEEVQIDDFFLRRDVEVVENVENLLKIHYYVYDQNHVLLNSWRVFVLSEKLNAPN